MAFSEKMFSPVQPLGLHEYVLLTLGVSLLPILYYICLFTYNIFFHPLSKYPGPRIASATPWWIALSLARGTTPRDLLKLHDQYGLVVRTSPNELSYIDPVQFKEIYGHKGPGQPEFAKDEKYHSGMKGGPVILNADRHYHGYIRKLLANGFSEKALREQEPVIREYVDLLFQRLHQVSQDGTATVDIVSWYNFMTFDFSGFLTFGESFDCLNNSRIHKWIEIFFSFAKFLAFNQAISRFPLPFQTPLKLWAIPMSIKSDNETLQRLNTEKIKNRLEHESGIPDFMDKLIEAYNSGKMTFEQLTGNASILIAAGSETTATLLAGLTFLLLKNPRVLQKLTREIRGAFQSPEEITITRLNQCKYLLACIEEALRFYPPSPQPHQRIIPAGGASVNGEYLPEGVAVSIPIYAACRSARNWSQPDYFIPERWTGEDPQFNSDKRDASQPFSFGPRNCIGRNLAYVEMKLIIARLIWHFDIENATEGDWLDQKVYMIWEKTPLWIKLHPVWRSEGLAGQL
ncbi:cytochrome P450 [Hypoxylon sp. FL1857]|nr:cytochrome P450 [Hypoxylon sp. FL1857]